MGQCPDLLTYAWFPRNTEELFGGLCQKSLRVQSVARAESPHANRILGVKTAENYATGFRAYVGSSGVWNPIGALESAARRPLPGWLTATATDNTAW